MGQIELPRSNIIRATTLNHIQLYVSDRNVSFLFYKDLLGFLGFETVCDDEKHLGMRSGETDIWLKPTPRDCVRRGYSRRSTGINHIAFGVRSIGDVDRVYEEFLKPRRIATLYGTPREFPDYTPTYYAVFFEDPDRIKLEVVHL